VCCAAVATRIVDPKFLKIVNSELHANNILHPPPIFFLVHYRRTDMVISCKIVVQHTLLVIPLVIQMRHWQGIDHDLQGLQSSVPMIFNFEGTKK
jgi:hypothetical protein